MALPINDKDYGTRTTYEAPADIKAKLDAMNARARGVVNPPLTESMMPASAGVTAPSAPSSAVPSAAANLQKIFAPAAPERASTPSAAPVASAPVPVASQPAPARSRASNEAKNINGWIKELMNRLLYDGGMGDELRMDLRNQATQTSKVRERDRILRRGDDFAARGLFGSGLSKNAISGIEAEESGLLQNSLNEIEFQNAQMEAQSLRDAISALNAQIQWKLGKGMLNVQREQLALAKLQHAEQMALAWAKFNWDKLNAAAQDPGPSNPYNQASNAIVGDNPPINYGSGNRRDGNLYY